MNIDDTIREVERLYKSVTGTEAPPVDEDPYAAIPPEVDPQVHVEAQVERLAQLLAQSAPDGGRSVAFTPPLSVFEGEEERVFRLDLPGVRRDDVEVALVEGSLVVRGHRQTKPAGEGLETRWHEAPRGRFERVMPLPRNASDEELDVTMNDGCLEIRVPTKGTASSRMIEIR